MNKSGPVQYQSKWTGPGAGKMTRRIQYITYGGLLSGETTTPRRASSRGRDMLIDAAIAVFVEKRVDQLAHAIEGIRSHERPCDLPVPYESAIGDDVGRKTAFFDAIRGDQAISGS